MAFRTSRMRNTAAVEQLIKINGVVLGRLAYLVKRLAETPEPGGEGKMLDHTVVIWLNELGKGNTHTLDDIPFVLIGGKGHGFKAGRSLEIRQGGPQPALVELGPVDGAGS